MISQKTALPVKVSELDVIFEPCPRVRRSNYVLWTLGVGRESVELSAGQNAGGGIAARKKGPTRERNHGVVPITVFRESTRFPPDKMRSTEPNVELRKTNSSFASTRNSSSSSSASLHERRVKSRDFASNSDTREGSGCGQM